MVISDTRLPPNAQPLSLMLGASGARSRSRPSPAASTVGCSAATGGIAAKCAARAARAVPGFAGTSMPEA